MFKVTDQVFDSLITDALDTLPKKYISKLNNVVITIDDRPSLEQRQKLHLHDGQTLYGLYEGIPMTQRGSNYSFVLPDKITIFKEPIEFTSSNLEDMQEQVRHTLWHEIAHFFGLGHDAIYRRDGTLPPKK